MSARQEIQHCCGRRAAERIRTRVGGDEKASEASLRWLRGAWMNRCSDNASIGRGEPVRIAARACVPSRTLVRYVQKKSTFRRDERVRVRDLTSPNRLRG